MANGEQSLKTWDNLMKGAQRSEEAKKLLAAWRSFLYTVCWTISLQGEVFLRRRFGERYMSISAVVFSLVCLGLFSAFALDDREQGSAQLFAVVFVMVSAVHFALSRIRANLGVKWHSRSGGVSWIPSNDWSVELIIEPLIALGFSFFLIVLNERPFGQWFVVVGVAMFIKAWISLHQSRNAVLDILDNKIEAEVQQQAFAGRPQKETHGFVIPGASRWNPRERSTIQNALSKLDQEFAGVVTDSVSPSAKLVVNARNSDRSSAGEL